MPSLHKRSTRRQSRCWPLVGLLVLSLSACGPGAPARPATDLDTASVGDGWEVPPDSGEIPPDSGPLDASPVAHDVTTPLRPEGCGENGALLSQISAGAISREGLLALVEPDVAIDQGYTVHRLKFCTLGREAFVTVTVPLGSAPVDGWHVAMNNPGTVGVADVCTLGLGFGGAGLAGYFGARGLVGVALDYPGLGSPGPHPYLVSAVEGSAALDGLRATYAFLAQSAVPFSGRSVMAGLSQGGHATLAAAMIHQAYAPELQVKAFAVAGPARMYLEDWQAGIRFPGPHLVYYALLTYAWTQHYGHLGPEVWAPDISGKIPELMESLCLFDPLGADLGTALGTSPEGIFSSAFLTAFAAGDFGDYPAMATGFEANRIQPYSSPAPLRIYQGELDAVVLPEATAGLVIDLAAGGVDVELISVPEGGHTDIAFFFISYAQSHTDEAIAWLKHHLDAP